MMADDLMCAETRLQPASANRLVETLQQLGLRLGDDWAFEASWDRPCKEEVVSLGELVSIVQTLTIPGDIRYVIGAGKPNTHVQPTAEGRG